MLVLGAHGEAEMPDGEGETSSAQQLNNRKP